MRLNTFILLLVAGTLAACSSKDKPNVELIQDMMESPAIKAQEYDEESPDHRGMRVPPEHTVPVGFKPYAYPMNLEGADKNINPLAGQMTPEVLTIGQKFYYTNCAICHGEKGQGGAATSVAEKLALKPPPVISDKVKAWTDGHIYHVITEGQGVMGPYASHIPQKYRWQVVNYIRYLQKEAQ